jgi:hypothetical protein
VVPGLRAGFDAVGARMTKQLGMMLIDHGMEKIWQLSNGGSTVRLALAPGCALVTFGRKYHNGLPPPPADPATIAACRRLNDGTPSG